jgi:beta-glucosidase
LNESSVNADMSGRQAEWPPYLCGDDGMVKVMMALARGIVQSVKAMKAVHPKMITIQVEALWHNWTQDLAPEMQEKVAQGNERQYLCFDLCTGRLNENHPLYGFLRTNGVTEKEIDWFLQNYVSFDILGANFYPWSYGEVVQRKDGRLGRIRRMTHGSAIGKVLQEAATRTGLPIMVTETSAKRDVSGREKWMNETLETVCALRSEGVPVIGYTWFPIFSMFEWKYRTGRKPLDTYLLDLGLYNCTYDSRGVLLRNRTSLVDSYKQHINGSMPPLIDKE